MTSSRARILLAACAFVALSAPSVANAQRTAQDIETARQLYNQGIQLRDKGDLRGALDKLRAAHALGNTPITGIELCRTYAALRQPVEAREVCLGVARIAPTAQETPRSQEARAEASRIAEAEKPKIGALRIKLRGVDASAEPLVLIDGAAIPRAALGEPRAVNPGPHVVTAKVGSGRETRADVETKEGETKDLELAVEAPPPDQHPATPVGPAPVTTTTSDAPDNRRTLATVAFVVGGVAALVGVVGGLKAMSGESDLEKSCIAKRCGTELHDDLSSAKTWGNVSTVAFVISGVAVAGGLVALLTAPPKAERPAKAARARWEPVLGLGGVGVHGSF